MNRAASASYIQVRGITIKNLTRWPLNVVNSSMVYISDCNMLSSGNANQFAAGSSHCWASRCTIANIPDYGFALYGGVTDSGITSCTANSCAPGFGVLNDAGQPAVCSNVVIANCVSTNSQNNQPNFIVATNEGGDGNNSQVTVSNNVSVSGSGGGFDLSGLESGSIVGNMSHNDSTFGFDMGDTSQDFMFSSNIAQGTTYGVTGGSNNSCMFIGNFVPGSNYDTSGANCIINDFNLGL